MPPEAGLMHYLVGLLSLDRTLEFTYKHKAEFLILAVVLLECLNHVDLRRYWCRSVASDALHVLFYVGGFAAVLVFNPLFAAIDPYMSWLKLGLLKDLPPLWAFLVFFICGDFVNYWFHRLQHASPYLWVFHSVHHSATVMTGATSFRRHIGESFVSALLKYLLVILPLAGVLHAPWLVSMGLFTLCIEFTVIVQHAELDWHFGPFARLWVSPVFHAVHHSLESEHQHKNYGMILSTWDYLFGTALEVKSRPGRYGLDDEAGVPNTFTGQVLAPFKMFVGLLRPQRGMEGGAP